ncbi:cytochrome d ubiquinol oxidase subunit II [Sphingopyxis macrogoltabida]|uniref:Cytochrome BD ubiquinol oxidase subunit II n=1 Tax=Sphingopyxis macrogoltabida TaxID=33050 RepID=A0A0N9V4N0_SPHMC|nr:cytochrome d ubiquinol oxidase subunit II [Sphingopyxis macrogoltabida]ALH82812.1 cytochrome BD ubiquinol oxidase subunit II [Sphingopyxis macrogoltabida]
MTPFLAAPYLAIIFAGLMGLSILLYVILDGYDLGVGMLTPLEKDKERDLMVASIGPFWDANETWLVLGIGLLLVAFPVAHGLILTQLYLPVVLMLVGLILRGVAFEFRAKVPAYHKHWWDKAFFGGSLLTALCQGYMLGAYVLGFDQSVAAVAFCLLAALGLVAGYLFIGACWLIYKVEGELQQRAVRWAQVTLWLTALAMAVISVATPLMSERIFERWFGLPEIIALLPIPIAAATLFIGLAIFLRRPLRPNDELSWVPLAAAGLLFALGFVGIAYSFYPYLIADRLDIWQAAASPESLSIILIGALFVLPVILGYSILAHWIFRGKATHLSYE